ncbi:hypothetical protein C7460_10221 [Marinoscillum furvescens DSM 4134]|uniref:Uncharacterized protein n=1 Tax=Marinoscillum furvescens DSM 4134 TaxID=1122208 RepID=A0A3D9L9S2_MARFU|nr:hypothetical protein C7460_10221 [Marinoscillum furvescens DSM 4134]
MILLAAIRYFISDIGVNKVIDWEYVKNAGITGG